MWVQIALIAGQLALGKLQSAGVFSKRPTEVPFDEVIKNNQPSEIRPIVYAGGTIELTPTRIWYGDYKQRAVERDSHWSDYIFLGPFGPLLDFLTVAYRFYAAEMFALCYDEAHIERITIDDRLVFQAPLDFDNAGSGFLIDDPQAWGGDQPPGEGGQYSWCRVTRGNYTDATDSYVESQLSTSPNKTPSLRGIATLISYGPSGPVVESGYFAAGGLGYIPRFREWKVTVRRQPDNLVTGFHKIGRHMNPMETIYEWCTSIEYGARVPLEELNLANLQANAEQLHEEGRGWSGRIESQTHPEDVVSDVLRQIDAVRDLSPSLGLGFRLIRRDYSFGSLRILDKSVITEIKHFAPGTYEDTNNKVQVQFPDNDNNFEPRPALYIDPANQQITGRVTSQTQQYLGVADFTEANTLATRDGRALSLPRAPLECSVFPSWGRLTSLGEVVLFQWSSPSLSIVMRVQSITPNGPDERNFHLVLIEDQFASGLRTFGEPDGSGFTDPAAGLDVAPPSATWNEAEFPPDGLRFELVTLNTNQFQATIIGGIVFGTYAPGGQYARLYVTEPGGIQTLSPIRITPDLNNEAVFTWPGMAAGDYEFCVQTFSLRDATNGVKVCAEIAVAAIGSPSASPSASVSPSSSVSRSPSASASISPSPSLSPSASASPSSSISPSASLSPSSSASPSAPAVVVGEALLFTGTGAAQSITGASISPDMVFIKRRDGGAGGALNACSDSMRGPGLELSTSSTTSETTDAQGVTSFDANGFSVGTSSQWNASGATYIACVLEEVASAFDIVSYTGTGVARTVAHNLGVIPELMIVKSRTGGGTAWFVYPGPLASPETKFLQFQGNNAVATLSTVWDDTAPTSTDFTVGTAASLNANGGTFIAYLFASLNPGCAVGTYTGDGATNGPAITTGFKPHFVIIKRTDSTGNWVIFDDQRDASSPHNTYHHVNLGGAAADSVTANSAGGVDFLSNGFQSIDANDANINISGAIYIYLAIA